MTKKIVYLGASIGGVVGGYLPVLLGADGFSGWSIFGGLVGGITGIWIAYTLYS